MLEWRLVGRGLDNPQILAHDGRGGLLAINRVRTTGRPDQWWLTGGNYGLATAHDSQAKAKAAAARWVETGERPDPPARSVRPGRSRTTRAPEA